MTRVLLSVGTEVTHRMYTHKKSMWFIWLTRRYSKKSGSSHRWIQRQRTDLYTRDAKHYDYKSRAAFKLLQIDEKFKIFSQKRISNVLDLGAAPGAWSQVALERCRKGSNILGVDLLVYQPPNGSSSMQANILSKKTHESIKEHFKVVEMEKLKQKFQPIEVISNQSAFKIQAKSVIDSESELSRLEKTEQDHTLENVYYDELYRPVDVILSDMMANTSGLSFRDHAMSMDLCDAALITSIDLLKKGGNSVFKFFTGKDDKFLEERLTHVFRQVFRFKPKACRPESKECYFVCLDKVDNFVDKKEVFRAA